MTEASSSPASDAELKAAPLSLFAAFGVELEYMIVDAESLAVRPISDAALAAVAGEVVSEVELGPISWSNELAMHVLEFKTSGPAESLQDLPALFAEHVVRANDALRPHGAMLMPTAMHPWMDPEREMQLWPHEYNAVYESFHRIFDCRGHGWANLQSVHLNLPFADAEEFGRLHAAIRLILPLIPALAASSPIVEGSPTGLLDNRLEFYRGNARRVPLVSARVVPEAVFSPAAYERELLQPLYAAIAPLDRDGVLQHEWLNARGAIARFERGAIEIRVTDVQECPAADLAIVAALVEVLKALVGERWSPYSEQQAASTESLADLLLKTIRDADLAVIDDQPLLALLGVEATEISAGELWRVLIDRTIPVDSAWRPPLETILREGTLARRIMQALGTDAKGRLAPVYRELCACLATNQRFTSRAGTQN